MKWAKMTGFSPFMNEKVEREEVRVRLLSFAYHHHRWRHKVPQRTPFSPPTMTMETMNMAMFW